MMAKLLKSVIVLAVILMFFGGTAMADRRGCGGKHYKKWHRSHRHHYHKVHHHRYHHKRHFHTMRHHDHHRRHGRAVYRHPEYRKPRYEASKSHPLAPRVIFIGGLPVPVPPPPHEVLEFLTGH